MIMRDELLTKLIACQDDDDREKAHVEADEALLEYIDDEKITEAWRNLPKWFA